jgi:hypothetical protein
MSLAASAAPAPAGMSDNARRGKALLKRAVVGVVQLKGTDPVKAEADVRLRVQLVVINIPEIDTEGQTFMADVVVEAVAEGRHELVRDLDAEKEPGKDVAPKHKNSDKPPKPEALFDPGATILNSKDVELIEESVETRQSDAVWRWRWRGDFSEEFELFDFPFDVQDFSLKASLQSVQLPHSRMRTRGGARSDDCRASEPPHRH